MPRKTTRGPFATALGRPKPLTARERRAKKRKADRVKYDAAVAELERRTTEAAKGRKKPILGQPTAAQIQSKRAEERRAQATRGTFLERLIGVLSPAQPPKPRKGR